LSKTGFSLRGQSTPLIVVQARDLPAELILQYAILLDEVRDDVGMMAVDDARNGEEQHLEWVDLGQHSCIVAARKRVESRAIGRG